MCLFQLWFPQDTCLVVGLLSREQTYGPRGKEEGEGEMYGESNMETYNTRCKIDSQWEFAVLLWELKQGLCNNLLD